jgi:hypothetical protein
MSESNDSGGGDVSGRDGVGSAEGAGGQRVALEQIAALLDGRLDSAARADVMARVAASPEDAAVLAEAVAMREALGADAAATSRSRSVESLARAGVRPWWKRPSMWGVAAAAALLIAVWPSRRLQDATVPSSADDIWAMTAGVAQRGLPTDWNRRPWGQTRGARIPERCAACLGVMLTDIAVSLRARDTLSAVVIAEEAQNLLQSWPAALPMAIELKAAVQSRDSSRLGSVVRIIEKRSDFLLVTAGIVAEARRLSGKTREGRDRRPNYELQPSVRDSVRSIDWLFPLLEDSVDSPSAVLR